MRILLLLALSSMPYAAAQTPPPAQGAPRPPLRRVGGFVPGQKRAPEDPAKVARGKTIYEISCRGCHGADLRGGDMGGPNLLRSQLCLSDLNGELIIPIIEGSRQETGMPKIPMKADDAKAVSAFVRSIMATIGGQGMPPEIGKAPTNIVVGDAKIGQAYFDAKCAGCHSVTGDLKGIAKKYADPKVLQNSWVAGGGRAGRGPAAASKARIITAVVTTGSTRFEGNLIRIDDFLVTLELVDGSIKSFRRDGDSPKVEVRDPMKPHRDLLSTYSDDDIHNVTAYLVTIK